MSLYIYSILVIFGCIFFWVNWLLIVFYVNPERAQSIDFMFFYFNLFFALMGSIFLIGFILHKIFTKQHNFDKVIRISLRQSVLLSFFAIGSLWLQGQQLLSWTNVTLFIVILTIIEFFFISRNSAYRYHRGAKTENEKIY